MGREAQPPYSRLTPRLEADLSRINFYRLCQLLEKRNPDRPLMGSTSHPGDDPVRFAPHPGMGFPASELKAVEYDEEDDSNTPSLYEMLTGNFTGGLDLNQVNEENQVILSVLDNMQRILNCRAGTLAHLPDYGLPDMTKILQGMPGTAHELMGTLSSVLLKYEPRLKKIDVALLEQDIPGELRYAIDAELRGIGLVRYGTEFMPEGRVLLRHLKQQQYLDTTTRL